MNNKNKLLEAIRILEKNNLNAEIKLALSLLHEIRQTNPDTADQMKRYKTPGV